VKRTRLALDVSYEENVESDNDVSRFECLVWSVSIRSSIG